ncbi:hypothetical protein O6P43_004916 [Quillaja saponaria]|uniref:Uncharacterized protein n=1 Tax=Quillaja saponaria TaxID=32244 RepID=A0AAD7Q4U6_QUISA|nr:hypothetical protein O6P43_004916 [Quillaja saponaria]
MQRSENGDGSLPVQISRPPQIRTLKPYRLFYSKSFIPLQANSCLALKFFYLLHLPLDLKTKPIRARMQLGFSFNFYFIVHSLDRLLKTLLLKATAPEETSGGGNDMLVIKMMLY